MNENPDATGLLVGLAVLAVGGVAYLVLKQGAAAPVAQAGPAIAPEQTAPTAPAQAQPAQVAPAQPAPPPPSTVFQFTSPNPHGHWNKQFSQGVDPASMFMV